MPEIESSSDSNSTGRAYQVQLSQKSNLDALLRTHHCQCLVAPAGEAWLDGSGLVTCVNCLLRKKQLFHYILYTLYCGELPQF